MSFFKPKPGSGSGGPITESDLPSSVKSKLGNIGDLSQLKTNSKSSLTDATNEVATQLADTAKKSEVQSLVANKAEKTEVQSANSRIDELIINSGNANAEVTDAHVSSVKNKTFPTLSKRMEESEKEVQELARDKQLIVNTVENPLFSSMNSWTISNGTAINQDGKAIISATGSTPQILQAVPTKPSSGEKYYASFKVKIISGKATAIRIIFRDWTTGGTFYNSFALSNPKNDTIYDLDRIIDINTNFAGNLRLYVEVAFENNTGAYEAWQPIIVNLTKTYGAGKEPLLSDIKSIVFGFDNGFLVGSKFLWSTNNVLNKIDRVTTEVKKVQETVKNKIIQSGTYTSAKRILWTITYDDESKTIYDYAFPVHKTEKVPAMFFVVPNRINTGRTFGYGTAITWAELHEMINSGYFEIGHHTVDHLQTSSLSVQSLRSNIEQGLEILQNNGFIPKHFSYPGGANNASNRNVLRDYFESAGATTFNANTPESYDMHPYKYDRRSNDAWFSNFKEDLDKIVAKGEGWLVTYAHAIHPDGQINGFSQATGEAITTKCWTPTQLQSMIQYAKSIGVEIVSLDEGLRTYAPYSYYFNEQTEPLYAVQRNGVVINNPL